MANIAHTNKIDATNAYKISSRLLYGRFSG